MQAVHVLVGMCMDMTRSKPYPPKRKHKLKPVSLMPAISPACTLGHSVQQKAQQLLGNHMCAIPFDGKGEPLCQQRWLA